jgi:tellurite resistance protein TehA-like permease
MLLVLGVWRHRVRMVRLAYDPLYWGLVFPIGMYSVATFRLAAVIDVPFLLWIARAFVVAAAAVWLLTFLGLARRVLYLLLLALRPERSGGDSRTADGASSAPHAKTLITSTRESP